MEMKNLTHKVKEEIAANSFEAQWKKVKTDLHRVHFKSGLISGDSYYITSYDAPHGSWNYVVEIYFHYYRGNKKYELTTGKIRVRDITEVS